MRAFVGDIVCVQFIYFFLRLYFPYRKKSLALGIVFLMSFGVECYQGIFQPKFENRLFTIWIGESFHILDLVMYAIGILSAWFADVKIHNQLHRSPK